MKRSKKPSRANTRYNGKNDRVGDAAMDAKLSRLRDEWRNEHIQVRNGSGDGSPDGGLLANLAAEDGFPNCRPKGDLGYGIDGTISSAN